MDSKQNTIRKRKKKKFKAWKVVLVVMILAILTAIGAGAGMVFAIINTAPSINIDDFANLVQSTKIYDKDGNEIESLHGEENRTYVPLSKIKKYTQDAFIAIEDERFNEHSGIDIKRIFGALLVDLKTGSPSQGASTITQQLIKNRLLSRDKLLKRKIQEAYLAIQLEKKLSKSQILEYYLNTVYLGGSAYGVQAASEYYFSKNIDQLSIAESAVIAGINQSPTYYNPYNNEKSPEVYKDRATTVLSKMLENKFITNEEFEKAKTEIDKMSSKTFYNEDNNSTLKYQWFIEAAVDSVEKDLKDKYKFTDDEITQKIYSGGLRIYTTLDPKIQEIAESVAEDPKYYPTLSKSIATWGKDKVIQPQIGVVIDDYKTGQVRAVVGGRNIKSLKSLNRATSVPRQPGSSMKPLAVYGPAFDTGYSPASVIDDSPLTPEVAKAAGWKDNPPHNFDNKFVGLTTIRDGIKVSKNIVAVKLMLKLGVRNSIEYLKKFGLQNLVLTPNKQGQTDVVNAIALGGMTKGVTPLEMAAAYGTFGNGGIYEQPILY
ncbi:MAG TPA: hypothetical protein DD426_05555, partial [Clostridiaceae bacterium]|nr:hypothetical protein [Clostridiaceae bacterium]